MQGGLREPFECEFGLLQNTVRRRLREIKSISVNPLLLSVPCPCIVAAAVKISDLKLAGMISNTKKVKIRDWGKTFRFTRARACSLRVPQKLAICLSYAND